MTSYTNDSGYAATTLVVLIRVGEEFMVYCVGETVSYDPATRNVQCITTEPD